MTERRIEQTEVAAKTGRSTGYVSEHLSGKRAVDTDLIDAIADLGGVSSRRVLEEVARRLAVAEEVDDVGSEAERIAGAARQTVRAREDEEVADAERKRGAPRRSDES